MSFQDFIDKHEPIEESSLSAIQRKYSKYDSGTVTAFFGTRTHKENMRLFRELRADAENKGYSVTALKGEYDETDDETGITTHQKEESLFIADIKKLGTLKSDLIKWGKKYGQNSVTFAKAGQKYSLIFTNDNLVKRFGAEQILGTAKFGETNADGQSRINGRTFAFKG